MTKLRAAHVLVIAEAGVNHDGDIDKAAMLIDVAADAGADIVKFQSFNASLIISPAAAKATYQKRTTDHTQGQLDMVRSLELSEADHDELIARCRTRDIQFLSTPFDEPSIQLLASRWVTLGKIPSGDVTNRPYLESMARSFSQLIMSTGMCTMDEVAAALDVLTAAGAVYSAITLLHCNTAYPTPMHDVNLRAISALREQFGLHVGYSDHTLGIEVPIAAVALGATVIEKHITLDRDLPGPDHAASLEPAELTAMVSAIRNIERALGDGAKGPTSSEAENIGVARKSIHLATSLPSGHFLEPSDLLMLRPGDGISPMDVDTVVGRPLAADLPAGTQLEPRHLR